MRSKTKSTKPVWKRWFAWYPIDIAIRRDGDGFIYQTVWLEYVWRKRWCGAASDGYYYLLNEPRDHDEEISL